MQKIFLLSFDNFDNFKNFTLSKEQLILHTEKSLRSFVRNAGYKSIKDRILSKIQYE